VSWLADNPHVRFFDSRQRGYVSVDLRPQRMEVAFRAISDPADPSAAVTTLQRFIVADGRPGPVAV
jgi:alkaline phosphatase D